jgi:hypothetical protein
LAKRIGLVNTMVFTHLPSSLLLVTGAYAPSFPVAAALFLLREGLVEMDVPTRQSYGPALILPPRGNAGAPQSGGAREQRAAVELAQAVRTGASGCAEVAPTCEPPSRSRPSWSSASKRIHAVVAALGQCRNHVHNQLAELV